MVRQRSVVEAEAVEEAREPRDRRVQARGARLVRLRLLCPNDFGERWEGHGVEAEVAVVQDAVERESDLRAWRVM
jgi:hypothetical protein